MHTDHLSALGSQRSGGFVSLIKAPGHLKPWTALSGWVLGAVDQLWNANLTLNLATEIV